MAEKTYSACSAQLRIYIERYLRSWKPPEGKRRSMRELGRKLGWDDLALVRWSTAVAPRHWRIPIERIVDVSKVLGLSADQFNELMSLRLQELESENKLGPIPTVARWLLTLDGTPPWFIETYGRIANHYWHGLPGGGDIETAFKAHVNLFEQQLIEHHDSEEAALLANQVTEADRTRAQAQLFRARERMAQATRPRIARKVRSMILRIKERSKNGPATA